MAPFTVDGWTWPHALDSEFLSMSLRGVVMWFAAEDGAEITSLGVLSFWHILSCRDHLDRFEMAYAGGGSSLAALHVVRSLLYVSRATKSWLILVLGSIVSILSIYSSPPVSLTADRTAWRIFCSSRV